MHKRDGRKRNPSEQERLRLRTIEMWEKGMKPTDISNRLGMSLASVYNWLKRYQDGGAAALKSKPRRGASKKVDGARMRAVAMKIVKTLPNQHGHNCGLWKKTLIGLDLARQHNLKISRWTLGRLCRQMGLIPNRLALQEWLRQFAEIMERTEDVDPVDETNTARGQFYFASIYPIDGQSLIGEVWSSDRSPGLAQAGCCMMGAVTLRGDMHFMVAPPVHTDTYFRKFIDQLMIGQKRRVILVVSKVLVSSRRVAQECVRKYTGRIRLFVVSSFETGAVPSEIRA